jgi:hypothetical protein
MNLAEKESDNQLVVYPVQAGSKNEAKIGDGALMCK